jgi:hypothetical protein
VLAVFIALMIGAVLSLRDMGSERRTSLLGKLLGKVVMFLGALAVGAILLTTTLGNALPIGQVQSVIQQVQGVLPGSSNTPVVVPDQKVDVTIFEEISQKLSSSGVFSPNR